MIDESYGAKERGAVVANEAFFNEETTRRYVDVSPHVKYASLRRLYGQLAGNIFADAQKHSEVPSILDLGAGEGFRHFAISRIGRPSSRSRRFYESAVGAPEEMQSIQGPLGGTPTRHRSSAAFR